MQSMNEVHTSANKKAIKGICMFFGACILIGGITYSEILFLGIISNLFPSGPMAIGAMLGAVTTGASVLLLVLAKSHWFRPGSQLIVAWIFTGVEVLILIFNDILAYQIHQGGQLDQYTATWRLFCVAAPVISVVGWILCFYFDPQRSIDHKRMEMEDNHQKAQIDFEHKMHTQVLMARYKAAGMVGTKLEEKIETQLNYHLEKAAAKFAAKVASDFIGENVSHVELMGNTPKQLPTRVVNADPIEEETEEAASRPHTVDPSNVREKVDNEKKPLVKKPLIDFSLPKGLKGKQDKQTQKIDTPVTESPVETTQDDDPLAPNYSEDDTLENGPSDDDPSKWNLVDWRQYRNEVDAWTFDQVWEEYHGDIPFPNDRLASTKRTGGKQSGKVTRRQVLGMENQDD